MAMYIMVIGVLTFAGLAVFANKVAVQSKIRAAAYQIGSMQLETLRTTSFDNLRPVTNQAFGIPPEVIASLPGSSNTKYQVDGRLTIQELSDTRKQINIRIRWRNAATNEAVANKPWSEVRLSSMLTSPGSVTGLDGYGAVPPPPSP